MSVFYKLIEWLKVKSRVFSWDVVAVLHAEKVNHLLEQGYIKNVANNSYLPTFSEPVVVNGVLTYYLHDFLLDWPRLSFDSQGLDDSLAHLKMVVIAGRLVSITAIPNGWQVYSLDAITPLHGPVLSLDVLLREAGGRVEDSGHVLLDLSNSDNFSMDIDDDDEVSIITGELFQESFRKLDSKQRVFLLGQIKGDAPEHLRPYSFALRTQRDEKNAAQAGAVLVFISLKSDHKGEPPHSGADFEYLLPSDYPKYEAAVLLSTRRIMVLALVPLLEQRFNSTPVICYDDELLGWLAVPDAYIEMDPLVKFIDKGVLGWNIWVSINTPPGKRQQADDCKDQDFVIALTETGADLTWKIDVSIKIDRMGGLEVPNAERQSQRTLRYHYTTHYKVVDDELVRVMREAGTFEAPDGAAFDQELMAYFKGLYEFYKDPDPSGSALAVMSQCVAHMKAYAAAAVLHLDEHLLIDTPVKEWVDQLIELSFGETMLETLTRGPCDVARFARVDVAEDTPKVSPLWPIIGSGAEQPFTAQSESAVEWDIEPLVPGPTLGCIDKNTGVYTAPSADKFDTTLWRERIKATTATGAVGYSLATVTRENLLISPLVRLCQPDEEVDLVASASAAEPDKLVWTAQVGEISPITGETVKFAKKHERKFGCRSTAGNSITLFSTISNVLRSLPILADVVRFTSRVVSEVIEFGPSTAKVVKSNPVTGKAVKYTAPVKDRKQAYVIDHVQVNDPGSDATFTAYLITLMTNPMTILVKVDESAGTAELSVPNHQLYPSDEVEWTCKGPGRVVGVEGEVRATYTPGPSDAPFSLVELEIREYDVKRLVAEPIRLRGVVILPLPLHRYALPEEPVQP